MTDVTGAIARMRSGDDAAMGEAFGLVYDELRALAHRQLQRLRPGDTLSTTALVHEAFLKLVRADVSPEGRRHFFALAARAMRQILVDLARVRSAQKRGGELERISLDTVAIPPDAVADELLAIDSALGRLEALEPDLARIVEWRFFGGMSEADIAAALQVSDRTVRRNWRKARAFLYREIGGTA